MEQCHPSTYCLLSGLLLAGKTVVSILFWGILMFPGQLGRFHILCRALYLWQVERNQSGILPRCSWALLIWLSGWTTSELWTTLQRNLISVAFINYFDCEERCGLRVSPPDKVFCSPTTTKSAFLEQMFRSNQCYKSSKSGVFVTKTLGNWVCESSFRYIINVF